MSSPSSCSAIPAGKVGRQEEKEDAREFPVITGDLNAFNREAEKKRRHCSRQKAEETKELQELKRAVAEFVQKNEQLQRDPG